MSHVIGKRSGIAGDTTAAGKPATSVRKPATSTRKPPRTPAQRLASRRNGAQSRGPTSPAGKRRSSANAIRHGLLARVHLLPGESNPEAIAASELLPGLIAQYRPESQVDVLLVELLASDFAYLRCAKELHQVAMDPHHFNERLATSESGAERTDPHRLQQWAAAMRTAAQEYKAEGLHPELYPDDAREVAEWIWPVFAVLDGIPYYPEDVTACPLYLSFAEAKAGADVAAQAPVKPEAKRTDETVQMEPPCPQVDGLLAVGLNLRSVEDLQQVLSGRRPGRLDKDELDRLLTIGTEIMDQRYDSARRWEGDLERKRYQKRSRQTTAVSQAERYTRYENDFYRRIMKTLKTLDERVKPRAAGTRR
jgi:hypothetical protein